MTDDLKNQVKEIKILDKKIKDLVREIKKDFKCKEHEGYVIDESVKRTILEGVYYIKDKYTYNMFKDNLFTILFNIPDHIEKQNEISETIYKKLLDEFYFNMDITHEYECNMSIISCINNIKKITEWNRRQLSSNSVILFENIRHSGNKNKKHICLKLLKNIENLHNQILETKIINILDKTEDENKLKVLDSLIEFIKCPQASLLSIYIDKILDYIELENDEKYFQNLNKIVNNFYYLITHSKKVEIEDLEQVLKINLENYNNKNINLLLRLINVNLYNIDPFNISLLQSKILDMDYTGKEFEDKFIDIINKIVLNIEDINLQEKIIERVCSVKNVKSLEVFTDLYPILNKYSNEEDLIDVVDELSKENIEILGNVKKLTIPIKYKIKED